MPFDPFRLVKKLEGASPKFARRVAIEAINLVSPFNAHLKAELLEWSNERSRIKVRLKRTVKNHVGSIHAGALFTLGETCAGIIVVRNFPFDKYRPLMSEVKVTYSKQARGTVTGTCTLTPQVLKTAQKDFDEGKVPFIDMETKIANDQNELIAVVHTLWQVKPWQKINTKK